MDDALQTAVAAGLPYTGLRDFDVDPKLWHYLPKDLARREQVVPVVLIGDTLKIAAATAAPDLSSLHEHLPNLKVELVISPADEIATALQRAA